MPDALAGYPLAFNAESGRAMAEAERGIAWLETAGAGSWASVARFLLRSEAIASSRIEGVAPSPQQVALAELGQYKPVHGVSVQAQLVANNMTVVREAKTRLVNVNAVTVDDIVELHRALLPDQPQHHGLRRV